MSRCKNKPLSRNHIWLDDISTKIFFFPPRRFDHGGNKTGQLRHLVSSIMSTCVSRISWNTPPPPFFFHDSGPFCDDPREEANSFSFSFLFHFALFFAFTCDGRYFQMRYGVPWPDSHGPFYQTLQQVLETCCCCCC